MKIAILAIALIEFWISSANAYDWVVKSTLDETLEAHDNRKLNTPSPGPSYNSISSVLLDAKALTATSRFYFTGNVKYRQYAGPGETDTLNALDNTFSTRFEKFDKLTTYNVLASRSQTELSSLQLIETGFATLQGSRILATLGGGFRRELSPIDTLAAQTTWTSTELTLQNSSNFTTLSTALDETHQLNAVASLISSLQYQQLQFTDLAQTEVDFWQGTMGVKAKLSPVIDFDGRFGAVMTTSHPRAGLANSTFPNPSGLGNPFGRTSSGATIDWIGNMRLVYSTKTGSLAFTAAQVIAPSILGDFIKTDTVGLSGTSRINGHSGISLTGTYSLLNSAVNGNSKVLSAVASYNYRILRDLRSQISYRYMQRASGSTTASDNAIIFNLTRDVDLIGHDDPLIPRSGASSAATYPTVGTLPGAGGITTGVITPGLGVY